MTSSSSPRDAAVSPIIATILLVVLTVTVIAVAAVVVINISEGYGDQKTVDIRVSPTEDNGYKVVVTGGADAAELTSLSAHVDGVTFEDGGNIPDPAVGLPGVLKVASSPSAGEALMTLIGTFTDGTVQLVYEGRVKVGAGGTGSLPKPVQTTKPIDTTEQKQDEPPEPKTTGDKTFTLNNNLNLWELSSTSRNNPREYTFDSESPMVVYRDLSIPESEDQKRLLRVEVLDPEWFRILWRYPNDNPTGMIISVDQIKQGISIPIDKSVLTTGNLVYILLENGKVDEPGHKSEAWIKIIK